MKVALYGQKSSEALSEIFDDFIEILNQNDIEFIIAAKLLNIIPETSNHNFENISVFYDKETLDQDIDLLFSFGGDGTILNAATIVHDLGIPIVGVNTGRLGFLATINKNVFLDHVSDILSGKYNISKRSLIEVITSDATTVEYPFALNEVSVTRRETTSMITVDAYVNDLFLCSFWSDGLIISTPTGSTGYNLSCGGPIIHPTCSNFVVTPIAPHNLNVRPLILSDDSEIKLKIHSREPNFFISLDGRNSVVSNETLITLRKAPFFINVIQLENSSYLDTLREKLYWGLDKRN